MDKIKLTTKNGVALIKAMEQCVSPDKDRECINYIYFDGCFLMATDGYRCVRVKSEAFIDLEAGHYELYHKKDHTLMVKKEEGVGQFPNVSSVCPAEFDSYYKNELPISNHGDVAKLQSTIQTKEEYPVAINSELFKPFFKFGNGWQVGKGAGENTRCVFRTTIADTADFEVELMVMPLYISVDEELTEEQ